jgi:GMP synthase (glutamine-hydrolysing)
VLLKVLVAESETPDEREARREHTGKSSGESYAATLEQLMPGVHVTRIAPADEDARTYTPDELAAYDGVFLTGSPLHVYDHTPAVRRQLAFMRAVFASGTPAFGSCAGLQVAVAAAGGTVRKMPDRLEAGIARRIVPTAEGRDHPLLAGRTPAWDAPAIHGDEVEALPECATLLAGNGSTRVQAAEIRYGGGVFWGVQYHPELSLAEIATALRRQNDGLVDAGLARDQADVEAQADLLDALDTDPGSRPLRWRLGVDAAFAEADGRRIELGNFIRALVLPRHAARSAPATP